MARSRCPQRCGRAYYEGVPPLPLIHRGLSTETLPELRKHFKRFACHEARPSGLMSHWHPTPKSDLTLMLAEQDKWSHHRLHSQSGGVGKSYLHRRSFCEHRHRCPCSLSSANPVVQTAGVAAIVFCQRAASVLQLLREE